MSARRPVNNSAGPFAGNQLYLNDLPPPPASQRQQEMSLYSSYPTLSSYPTPYSNTTCAHCGYPFVTARGTESFVGGVVKGSTAIVGGVAAIEAARAAAGYVGDRYPGWGGATLKSCYQ